MTTVGHRRHWSAALRRRLGPILFATVFYYGLLVYPVLRLIVWMVPDWQPTTASLLAIMVLPLALRFPQSYFPNRFTRALATLSLTWLGIAFQLFLLVVAVEILRWIVPLDDRTWGMGLLATIGVVALAGLVNAQVPSVKKVRLDLGAGTAGRSLAQISDVHIGSRRPGFLRRIVKRLNRLEPDAVLITGDLIDATNVSQHDLRWLGRIDAPTYFILGNHERYEDTEAILERLTALGVRVLRNESVDAPPFQFIGIDDADARDTVARGLRNIRPLADRCRVLLYHKPVGAEDAARWGAHLMVSGHTHKGQIFPFYFIVKRVFPRIAGSYQVDGLHLYVNSGTGTWGPIMRMGTRSEVTHFVFD